MGENISEYGMVLLFVLVAILFTSVSLFAGKILSPKSPNEEKLSNYECGEETIGNTWVRFNIRFYIVALIFILFDVELVFLFPWAIVFGREDLVNGTQGLWGWYALAEMFIFVGILALGLAYAWVKGHLNWVKPDPQKVNYKSPVPSDLYEKFNVKYSKNS